MAACPQDGCFPGGGPPANDCLVEWSGTTSGTISCHDGDPTCDADGTADGTCHFALGACLNVPSSCAPGSVTSVAVRPAANQAAQALGDALGAIVSAGTTTPVCTTSSLPVAVRILPAGSTKGVTRLASGVSHLVVTASAGARKDVDRLTLTCEPPLAPSFRDAILPLIRVHCAVQGCHTPFDRSGGLDLSDDVAHAALVNVPTTSFPPLVEVAPGSLKRSYLTRKLEGRGKFFGTTMPQGCPLFSPCLTDADVFAFLAWIQGGAPDN